jgi:RNA polymerase sigma-70 factor (ECF subfamily)
MGALQALRTNPPRRADLPWLLGIARHKLVDHWRRRERAERNLRLVTDEADEPVWQDTLDTGRAADALEGLSAQYRLVLTLRYLDDLPVRGVAELLGRSEHSTESLLARARRAFRAVYEAGEGEPSGC